MHDARIGFKFGLDFGLFRRTDSRRLKEENNDAVIRGEFKDGELVGDAFMFYETPEGEKYFGDIANRARDGFGTLVHASGDT